LKDIEDKSKTLEAKVQDGLLNIPNLPHASVPSEATRPKPRCPGVGAKRSFGFLPKDHQDVGENLGILDFERAAKISGARFALLAGEGARLERALIQFMLELHTRENGYAEVFPPFMVNRPP